MVPFVDHKLCNSTPQELHYSTEHGFVNHSREWLNTQRFCTSNQTFKNRSLVVFFSYIYTYKGMDLAIVSLVGITTGRAEPQLGTMKLWLHLHTYMQRGAVTQVYSQGVQCTWPQGGICSSMCHYTVQSHSEHDQLQCNPTATSTNQCKQQRTWTEHE